MPAHLKIPRTQLGMAVSHLGLGLYFHHLTGVRKESETVMERGNVTANWSKEEVSLGVIGWLPLPLVLSFTVSVLPVDPCLVTSRTGGLQPRPGKSHMGRGHRGLTHQVGIPEETERN